MELKQFNYRRNEKANAVLIVPFMELKPKTGGAGQGANCLNRTFYGIETQE